MMSYYLELGEQFRQAREDAERLLEEREETNRKIRELEAENENLHEQLLIQKSYAAGLQEQQRAQERNQPDVKISPQEKGDCQGQRETAVNISPFF